MRREVSSDASRRGIKAKQSPKANNAIATYILVSFEAAPPAIFCTRRVPSSVFNSSSCFLRSSLFLPQSWPILTLEDDCHQKYQHMSAIEHLEYIILTILTDVGKEEVKV